MRTLFAVAGNLIALAAGFGLLARHVSPQVFWPPAIIALLLPGLLLLTLLFLLIQLARKHWASVVFPAMVLLFSLSIMNRLFAWPKSDDTDSTSENGVIIVTGNQRMFRKGNGSAVDPESVRSFFQHLDADIVMLQEVWPAERKVNYIADIKTNKNLVSRHQKPNTLVATYADDLTREAAYFADSEYHGILVTDVATEIGTVRVINAHLQSNQISGMAEDIRKKDSVSDQVTTFGQMLAGYGRTTRRRAGQAEKIRQLIEESPHPVIVGGDFNDVPSSYMYNMLLSPRVKDAWVQAGTGLGTTFTGPIPGLRIDYLLVDTSLSVVAIERINSPWSDHRALRLKVTQ